MSIDTPTGAKILEEALLAQGYHGLYLDEMGYSDSCSCGIDDLMPCLGSPDHCRAGWRKPGSTDDDPPIGPTPPVSAADLETIGQQRLSGLDDEETAA